MQEIILVDPHTSGHHLSYIRIYTAAFIGLGCKVSILSPDANGLKEYLADLVAVHSKQIEVCDLYRRELSAFELKNLRRHGLVSNLVKSYFSYKDFREIAAAIKRNGLSNNSLVFILWLDSYISRYLPGFIVDLTVPFKFAGLYFHPSHIKHDYENNRIYRDLLFSIPLFKSRKLKGVGLFDEKILQKLKRIYRGIEFLLLPDVAEKHEPDMNCDLIRKILERALNRKIVALVGSLDRRKNLLNFFEAAKSCSDETLFFVCVGKLHEERFRKAEVARIREIISDPPDNLYFHDAFVRSDNTFDALFAISTVIFAVYNNFPSSSNMIVKSSLFRVPIIVSDEHLMGELVQEYGIGHCVNDAEPDKILAAIYAAINQRETYAAGFSKFNKRFSLTGLQEALRPLASGADDG